MKIKRMGLKEIFRRISANKIRTSESVCKQSSQLKLKTQLIIVADDCSIGNNCKICSKVLFSNPFLS